MTMFLTSDDITKYLRSIVNTEAFHKLIPEVLSYPIFNEKQIGK